MEHFQDLAMTIFPAKEKIMSQFSVVLVGKAYRTQKQHFEISLHHSSTDHICICILDALTSLSIILQGKLSTQRFLQD